MKAHESLGRLRTGKCIIKGSIYIGSYLRSVLFLEYSTSVVFLPILVFSSNVPNPIHQIVIYCFAHEAVSLIVLVTSNKVFHPSCPCLQLSGGISAHISGKYC